LIFFFISCNVENRNSFIKNNAIGDSLIEDIPWHHKDKDLDSIAGISLERAHSEFIKKKKGKEIIVAIIDTQVDILHEDLKNKIYVNRDEIPENGIDDDRNGYIDDIHGWNFLGHKDGGSTYYGAPDHMRIIKRLQRKFKDKDSTAIASKNYADYLKYKRALELRKQDIAKAEGRINYGERLIEAYKDSKEAFSEVLTDDRFTQQDLDSITAKDDNEAFLLNYLGNVTRLEMTPEDMFEILKNAIARKYTMNNIYYNDRKYIGDDMYDYDDINYGNSEVGEQASLYLHGTQIAGIIGAERNNGLGIRGISNDVSLMILSIAPFGDELDKDFYNAIRYAVDNGASVINFSSGKKIADNEEILLKALKYAEDHDVLIVGSAGNTRSDIDRSENIHYPVDYNGNKELVSNFLSVGSSSQEINESIYSSYSNYGKTNVDVFAPGKDILVTHATKKKYIETSGTSLSSGITSGIAALIRSYYPTLTAPEVKQILMDSSVKYGILVDVPTKENPEQQLPFSELSKSGGIVNAYNALLMAEQVVKGKE